MRNRTYDLPNRPDPVPSRAQRAAGLVRVLAVLVPLGLAVIGTARAGDAPAASGTASPAPAAPAPAPAPPATGTAAGATSTLPGLSATNAEVEYQHELKSVEEDVSALKERVFRSKATLELLKELILEGAVGGSRATIWHVNQIGGAYTMESAQYFVDGKNVFSKVDPGGSLDTLREIKVADLAMSPGKHTMQVALVLRGKGYQVFSYLRSYQFKVASSYTFELAEQQAKVIRAYAVTDSSLRSFTERPNIKYDERIEGLEK